MRISEIIVEGPAGAAGQAAGQTLGNISKGVGAVAGGITAAPKRIAKGIASGAAAFDKLMSPSKWFSGNKTSDNNDTVDNAANYKDSLKAVSQGIPPNANDYNNLKQLAADTQSPEEKAALQAAYSGQKLTPEQMEILRQLAYKI